MGTKITDEDVHVESIVFFLTEALRAAVESGDSVQQSLCEAPQLSANMNCGEIAERLALYRKHLRAVWSYEALMVAKIMRARELARELRALEVELRPELDTFRLATVSCADLQELLLPSAQNVFNGVDQVRRLSPEMGAFFDGATKTDPLAGYRIAGHTDIRLLLSACEALHYSLAARYGFETLPARTHSSEFMEEPLLLDDMVVEDEEAFLLTDFCEILPDAANSAGSDWRANVAGNSALPN